MRAMPEAAFMVGEHSLDGIGTLRDPLEAARWYSRAAEAGHVGAQSRLSRLYLFGIPETLREAERGPVRAGVDR